jgi:uncharacterized protein YkwD
MARWGRFLQGLFVAVLVAAGAGAVGFAPSAAQESSGFTTASYKPNRVECQFLSLINKYRASRNEGRLSLSKPLGEAATDHTRDMDRRNKMYHTPDLLRTVKRYGYNGNRVGENVAAGYQSAKAVFEAWKRSSGHNRNMLDGRFEAIGIAEQNGYWTTIFGDRNVQTVRC